MISSYFFLFVIYEFSHYPYIYYSMVGHPIVWIIFHSMTSTLFTFYTAYHFWIMYKDFTTMELMIYYGKNKDIVRYDKKSFKLCLTLIFGTPSLWKALIYPCLRILPINGLEYEY